MERITRNIPFLLQTGSIAIGGGLLAAIVSLWVSLHITDLSKSIPQDDLLWDYFIGLLSALVLWILLLLWPIRERKHLLLIWLPKIMITCFSMLFYEAQLGELDAFVYFEQGIKGEFPADFSATGLGTANIYRITYTLSFLTGDSYRALVVLYSFLGLVGIWLIYKAAMLYFGVQRVYLLYILALFPSLLFWPSILGKEPLQLLFLGIYTYGIAGWLRRKDISYITLVFLGGLLITVMRVWWSSIIVTPLFGVIFTTRSSRPFIRFLLSTLLMVGVFIFLQKIFDVKSISDSLLLINTVSRSL